MTIMFTTSRELGADMHMEDTLDNLKAALESAGFEDVKILVVNEKGPMEEFDYQTLKERMNGNLHLPRPTAARAESRARWGMYLLALRDAAVIRQNCYTQLISELRRM